MEEDVIDLRPYADVLLSKWYWLLGAGIVSVLIALGFSFLMEPTYQGMALVALAEPRQRVQFDPRIEAVTEDQPLNAYPELAMSDEVLATLLTQLSLTDVSTLKELRNLLEAEHGEDPSLLRLKANYSNPAEAATIANTWAELFVNRSNEIFGFQGNDQLNYFEDQLEEIRVELETTEQDLIEFQAQNRLTVNQSELNILKGTQDEYLKKKQEIAFLIEDIQDFRDQFALSSSNNDMTSADQITSMLLQLKAFNAGSNAPIQLQFDSVEGLTQQSRDEQILFLENLNVTLTNRFQQIDKEVAVLEPQILVLQKEQQEIETERAHFTRNIAIAEETYTTVARKVEEERITSQNTSSGVKLASRSTVPEEPVGRGNLFTISVAFILGVVFSILVVTIIIWWRT